MAGHGPPPQQCTAYNRLHSLPFPPSEATAPHIECQSSGVVGWRLSCTSSSRHFSGENIQCGGNGCILYLMIVGVPPQIPSLVVFNGLRLPPSPRQRSRSNHSLLRSSSQHPFPTPWQDAATTQPSSAAEEGSTLHEPSVLRHHRPRTAAGHRRRSSSGTRITKPLSHSPQHLENVIRMYHPEAHGRADAGKKGSAAAETSRQLREKVSKSRSRSREQRGEKHSGGTSGAGNWQDAFMQALAMNTSFAPSADATAPNGSRERRSASQPRLTKPRRRVTAGKPYRGQRSGTVTPEDDIVLWEEDTHVAGDAAASMLAASPLETGDSELDAMISRVLHD